MNSSDFRTEARSKLAGKWGKAVLITLVYVLITWLIGFIIGKFPENIQGILTIIFDIIEVPLAFGFLVQLFKLYKSEDTSYVGFLSSGFENFGKAWGITLHTILKCALPAFLVIVSVIIIVTSFVTGAIGSLGSASYYSIDYDSLSTGASAGILIGFILFFVSDIWLLVKSLYYSLANVIAIDEPALSSKEAVEKSQELMTGKRAKLFVLQLSFIGWAILAAISFGIGFLWLLPYMQFAIFAFYKNAAGDVSPVSNEDNVNNDPIN